MKKYKSKIKKVIHEMAKDLHDAGVLSNKTMSKFDKSCLVKPTTVKKPVKKSKKAAKKPKSKAKKA